MSVDEILRAAELYLKAGNFACFYDALDMLNIPKKYEQRVVTLTSSSCISPEDIHG